MQGFWKLHWRWHWSGGDQNCPAREASTGLFQNPGEFVFPTDLPSPLWAELKASPLQGCTCVPAFPLPPLLTPFEDHLLTHRHHKLEDEAEWVLAEKGNHYPYAEWSPQESRDGLHAHSKVVTPAGERMGLGDMGMSAGQECSLTPHHPESRQPLRIETNTYRMYRLSPLAYSFPGVNKIDT